MELKYIVMGKKIIWKQKALKPQQEGQADRA